MKKSTINIPLTFEQLRALSYIKRFEGLSIIALADYLEIKPITATKIVSFLASNKYISKKSNPSDNRAYQLFLTSEGISTCEKLNKISDDAYMVVTQGLPDKELKDFERLLKVFEKNIAQAI